MAQLIGNLVIVFSIWGIMVYADMKTEKFVYQFFQEMIKTVNFASNIGKQIADALQKYESSE